MISTIPAGIHTIPLPTTGRIANAIVTTPQNNPFGKPTIQNVKPSTAPWIAAVTPVPMTVDTVTSLNRFPSFSVLALEKGM